MHAINVNNAGVRFKISHRRESTLMEAFVNIFKQRNNKNSSDSETFWAFRNISFTVEEGESFGIIGKNGAGKSTLLQVLTGIYKPDEGIVERKGRLGLLQLGTGFHPELSGRDNIYLNGAILGLKKQEIDGIYDTILEFSEIERFIDAPLKTYSTGMTARLGFAIAINVQPDILLIDEVLGVGDESFRKKCNEKIEDWMESGRTIVLVSHSMNEIKRLCDRAVCLDKGRIVFKGSSSEAVDFYLEHFAK